MRLDYALYMAEAEGCLKGTKAYQKKLLFKDIKQKQQSGVKELTLTDEYLSTFGLTQDDLTVKDYQTMARI